MDSCPDAFVTLAERLADRAREITAGYFRGAFAIEEKPDRTPVTEADRAAEAAMRAVIAEAHPDHGILGEEYGTERPGADFLWVLDPIDGTKRFASGHVQFGTLIALLHEGTPLLGIIDMPQMEERWTGAAGRPTRHRDRHGEVREARCRPCGALGAAWLYTTSPQMFEGADHGRFERVRRACAMSLYGGECYAYGLTASGYADLVIEADMSPYDYLAQVPILAGAGGVISDWQGAPLGLDSDGHTLAAGDPRLHEAVLAALSET